jgi:nitrogen fixation protein FixH
MSNLRGINMSFFKELYNPKEFTGWHMLIVMAAFFGTIISVNLTLAFYANSTWTGLVVPNSYVASQSFDRDTAEIQRRNAMGWKVSSDYGGGVFNLVLKDNKGSAVNGWDVNVMLGRPARGNDDRQLQMTPQGYGRYTVNTDLADGQWQADITATNASGLTWSKSIRFELETGK